MDAARAGLVMTRVRVNAFHELCVLIVRQVAGNSRLAALDLAIQFCTQQQNNQR